MISSSKLTNLIDYECATRFAQNITVTIGFSFVWRVCQTIKSHGAIVYRVGIKFPKFEIQIKPTPTVESRGKVGVLNLKLAGLSTHNLSKYHKHVENNVFLNVQKSDSKIIKRL